MSDDKTSDQEKKNNSIGYDEAKAIARDPDVAKRRDLAARPDTKPELLFFLAEDRDPSVRMAVAQNPNTPRQADVLLARDENDEIRSGLARKIGRLMPDLPADQRSTLYALTLKALDALAEDSIALVRKVLAESLKDVANAPSDIVKVLASDPELSVAEPILEFSPVLSERDLVEIINSKPIQGAMRAIARRRELAARVSDAIVENGGDDDIAELLSNSSAQIREETLDFLVDRAEHKPTWHEPFVLRPNLSPRAALRLSNFVAMNLLDRLQSRLDLDSDTLAVIARNVEERLAKETALPSKKEKSSWERDPNEVEIQIERMSKAGRLRSAVIEKALARGDKLFVSKPLSHLSRLPESVVIDAVDSMNAPSLVSVVWKTGLQLN